LAWIVKLDKGEFIGGDVLVKQKENGVRRKLWDRDARPRDRADGYEVFLDARAADGDQRRSGAVANKTLVFVSARGARRSGKTFRYDPQPALDAVTVKRRSTTSQ